MAGVTKINPIVVTTNFEQVGKNVTWFNVVFLVSPVASTGPLGAIQTVYAQIQTISTIIAAGPVSATAQSFGVEGEFSATDLAQVQAAIQAVGIIDGVDLSGATVVAKQLVIA